MERLENVLSRVGLQRYQDSIVQNGFETWTDLLDITEEDMAELQIKRGHRRILQREIASCRGQAYHQPLSQQQVYQAKPLKRRYRHHPSRDLNAPKRPKSAFVLYGNSLRQNPDVSDLSFVDIAKLTGEKWRSLSSKEVEKWRIDAEEQKKRYSIKLTEYRGASIKRPQISHITTGTVRDIKTALDSGLISAEGEDWKTRPWIGSGLEILWFEQLDHGQAFTLERARRSIIKAIEFQLMALASSELRQYNVQYFPSTLDHFMELQLREQDSLRNSTKWIESLKIDPPFRTLPGRSATSVYRKSYGAAERKYYQVVDLTKCEAKILITGIAVECTFEPTQALQIISVNWRGLRIEVDDDVAHSIPEGQDSFLEFSEFVAHPIRREWDKTVAAAFSS
ncbi:hypothetical protein B7494_g4030 [Chlorociboria aeruginascens]|nr:hypothetical protein B7494_g4030 [Chlorociboria aeruginascens]